MSAQRSNTAAMDHEFLLLRARLLELAAGFDRLERAPGDVASDPRWEQLQGAVAILQSAGPERASRLQLHFSRSYAPDWQSALQIDAASRKAE